MNRLQCVRAAAVAALVIGLAGCGGETTKEDIRQWQAEGNVTKLVKELNSPFQENRLAAIHAIAELKEQGAVEPLAGLFHDADQVVQHDAIDAVAAIGGASAEKPMLEVLGFETSRARSTAATALGDWKAGDAVDPLIKLLDDDQDVVSSAAATALGKIGDPRAIAPMAAKLKERSFDLKLACVNAIRQIGGETAPAALAPALGDFSAEIRAATVEAMIEFGEVSAPFALEGLHSNGEFTRPAAAAILKGLGKVPTQTPDLVWYTLAKIPQDPKEPVDPALVHELAQIDGAIDALLEAAIHPTDKVRDYGFQALETIGEPAAAPAVAVAEAGTKGAARNWFAGRADWPGAPSWRLDLWGALTALDPKFNFNPRYAKRLANLDQDARTLLASKQFKPTAEYAPLLLAQTASIEKGEGVSKHADENKKLAERKLRSLRGAVFSPLAAGLNDEDISIAGSCADLLLALDPKAARPMVIEAFTKKVNAGEEIIRTGFLKTVTELEDPAVELLLVKIRPNDARAIQVFEEKYPGIHVSIIPMHYQIDPKIKAQPFRLKYLKNGKSKELKVVFRPNEEGEWVPTPPMPDRLP